MKLTSTYNFPLKILLAIACCISIHSFAQIDPPVANMDSILPMPPMKVIAKNWGANDSIITSAIWYRNELLPYKELDMVWVSNMSEKKLAKYIEEWNRLRNAVYVTYPYARIAGVTINDINKKLENVSSHKQRKEYIKSREKELRAQFTEPLTNLSVYQGKVLMKLINRQTGNNCYEIIKDYKNGVTARLYQTVAFFFGSSLKQDWDLNDKVDRQIENFVKEIDGIWYTNPYKPGIAPTR